MTVDPFTAYRPATLANRLQQAGLSHWLPVVVDQVQARIDHGHGDLPAWRRVLAGLDALPRGRLDRRGPAVATMDPPGLGDNDRGHLRSLLLELAPWRKGPFRLHGVDIDAEWRSDLKWQRVEAAGIELCGQRILDVGCGNGWYAWRMQASDPTAVVGVDPTLGHVMQAWAVERCIDGPAPVILPLALEALPPGQGDFDLVFSMGVLYHRRSPIDHLTDLRQHLTPGGRLLLETLVIEGEAEHCLCPPQRYARMRNVWFIPSLAMLERWLQRCGYEAVTLLDCSTTGPAEQRSTPWMPFQSLREALDPDDPSRTVEGLPAPRRALLSARRAGR